MTNVIFTPPTKRGVLRLLENVRDADAAEMSAISDLPFIDLIADSMARSSNLGMGWLDGEPIAVFGVVPISELTGHGCPWLIGTKELDRRPRLVVENMAVILDAIGAKYSKLTNIVHTDNKRAIRALSRFGFSFGEPFSLPSGALFMTFSRG